MVIETFFSEFGKPGWRYDAFIAWFMRMAVDDHVISQHGCISYFVEDPFFIVHIQLFDYLGFCAGVDCYAKQTTLAIGILWNTSPEFMSRCFEGLKESVVSLVCALNAKGV